jgi:WD40 repeat protein
MDAPATPFKGLVPFEASDLDALLFFGRERERDLIVANLLASRLTVLYGPVGVGKTSLLRAGVAHRLRQEIGPDGRPEYGVVVFGSWSDDPWASLRLAIEAELGDAADRELFLLIDQLEEYFLYHGNEDGPGTFAGELPELVTDPDRRISVLLSIREDALARLDRFKGHIPALFSNYLSLDHLDREAARAAILGPVDRYNRLADTVLEVEDALVEAVLDQTAVGRLDFGAAGAGRVAGNHQRQRIEAPYLQLVLRRLWDAERAEGSETLRLATFEQLGGAEAIVRAHLERALAELDQRERDLAASVFRHLVTPSGSKIAHAIDDLAEYAEVDARELRPVVTKLVEERILRPVAPAGDGSNGVPHEIYHDVLGDAVLAWRTGHETERRLEEERALARRKHRRTLATAGLALVALAVMTAIAVYALEQRHDARTQAREARERTAEANARALDASALRALDTNPENSLRLAAREARAFPSPEAEDTLRSSLLASRLRKILHVGGHVLDVSYSRDGRRILTVSRDGPARIYDARSGRLLRAFGAKLRLHGASLSRNGRLVVTAGTGSRAVLWNASTGTMVRQLRHGAQVRTAFFSDDGTLVVTAGGNLVRVWRVANGSLVQTIHVPRRVRAATLREDNRFLVVVASDRFARVYNVPTGRPLYSLDHGAGVTDALFVRFSKLVTSGRGKEGEAIVWSMTDGTRITDLYGHEGAIDDIALQPQAMLLATASTDGTARVWTLGRNPHLYAQLSGHLNPVSGVAFSPTGFSIVTRSTDGTARVWRPTGGLARAVLAGHEGPVTSAVFSPDGKHVVTGGADGTVRIWDPRTEPPLSLLRGFGRPIRQVARSADGKVLLVGTAEGASLVDAATGSVLRKVSSPRHVTAVALAGNDTAAIVSGRRGWIVDAESGRTRVRFRDPAAITAVALVRGIIATAGADGVVTLRRTDGSLLRRVRAGSQASTSVRFDRAGRRFATGSEDRTAKIFQVDGRRLHTLRGHANAVTAVSFSPDGRTLVTAARDGELRMWNVRTGKRLSSLRRHFSLVSDVEYSPDGRWIISAGPVTAGLWNARLKKFVFFLRGHRPRLTSALFEPDSQRIITAGTDGTLRTYRCDVCRHLPALLELAERRLAAAR